MPAVDGSPRNTDIYRIVVDTNVIISAIIFGGKPGIVFHDVLTSRQFITSDYIVSEFMAFMKEACPKAPQKWLRLLRQKLETYCCDDTVDLDKPVRDINDTAILQLAIKQRGIIVTNDKDLLDYKTDSQVTIISVAEYLELFMPFEHKSLNHRWFTGLTE